MYTPLSDKNLDKTEKGARDDQYQKDVREARSLLLRPPALLRRAWRQARPHRMEKDDWRRHGRKALRRARHGRNGGMVPLRTSALPRADA
jgi:hypothetical protein